jgi:glucose/arabinose dehydrogenase
MRRTWIALCCLTLVACDRKSPPSPPIVDPIPAIETVNGSERLGWDQPAADTVELATIGYAVYVDGARAELSGVACAAAAAAVGFPCTARLPVMSPGSHTLELASFVNDGGVLESARSPRLRVTLVAHTAQAAPNGRALALRDGLAVRAALVADGLESPTDLAVAPDGRLFVAERAGRVRVIRPPTPAAPARQASLLPEPAINLAGTLGAGGRLLALALDPQFERSRQVFAIYTAPARTGDPMFTLARFREVSDTLGDRAVILDGVPASTSSPSAALRFGPDGSLYAAFDDGGDARHRRDPASWNGKVLRLNADGTTPGDARGGTPVYADGYGSPVALDWDPPTATLWVADRAAGASAFAFYRGTLFPLWSGRLVGTETLFEHRATAAGAAAITIGPDGAIYFLSDGAVWRLAPDRGP